MIYVTSMTNFSEYCQMKDECIVNFVACLMKWYPDASLPEYYQDLYLKRGNVKEHFWYSIYDNTLTVSFINKGEHGTFSMVIPDGFVCSVDRKTIDM